MIIQVYLLAVLFALFSGSFDALLALGNRPISHRARVGIRAAAALAYLVWMVWAVGQWQPRLLLQVIGAGAAFVVAFRFWMNVLRTMHPAYISNSGRYDRWWMRQAEALGYNPSYGGQLAYTCESAVALIVAIIYTLIP